MTEVKVIAMIFEDDEIKALIVEAASGYGYEIAEPVTDEDLGPFFGFDVKYNLAPESLEPVLNSFIDNGLEVQMTGKTLTDHNQLIH